MGETPGDARGLPNPASEGVGDLHPNPGAGGRAAEERGQAHPGSARRGPGVEGHVHEQLRHRPRAAEPRAGHEAQHGIFRPLARGAAARRAVLLSHWGSTVPAATRCQRLLTQGGGSARAGSSAQAAARARRASGSASEPPRVVRSAASRNSANAASTAVGPPGAAAMTRRKTAAAPVQIAHPRERLAVGEENLRLRAQRRIGGSGSPRRAQRDLENRLARAAGRLVAPGAGERIALGAQGGSRAASASA